MQTPSRLAIALLACTVARAQDITLAEGSPTSLQIVAIPENAPTSAGTVVLGAVELLPIEMTGRVRSQDYDTSRSRRIERNGLLRVELPGNGRLFRYRRLGGQFFGYLHVDGMGTPRSVLELPAAGATDPFADRIAVAADGRHAAMALALSGMHLVRLDGGTFASTGRADFFVATSAPVEPTSVMVGGTHVFFVTADNRLWRCALQDGAVPVDVSPAAVPGGEIEDSLAMSGDGSKVVFLFGPRDQERLWLVDTTGPAAVLPPPPAKYEEPGYLPEEPGEPALLLDQDGTRLFYVDSTVRDEMWLLDVTGQLPRLQITDDPIFQPYIGSHILPSFAPVTGALHVAIGDPNRMDWFAATLTPQGGAVANLTGTGSLQQPFPSGTIDPVQATPIGGKLLVTEQGAGALVLREIDRATGAQAVVQQDLGAPPMVGDALTGPPDVVARGTGGDRLYLGTNANLLAATPPGLLLTPPNKGVGFAATWVHLTVPVGIVALYLPDGSVVPGPLEFGVTQLVATPGGGLLIVGSSLRYLAPGVIAPMPRPAVPFRVCLSGAGG